MDTKESLIEEIRVVLADLREASKQKITKKLNIFNILDLSEKELIHSKFISFLLDPNENHDCKTAFLDRFINLLRSNNASIDFKSQWEEVTTEHEIDNGRRIDIFIKNNFPEQNNEKLRNHIIIENKIYALDQKGQLKSYHNQYKNAILVYLTLNGKDPSRKSLGDVNNEEYLKENDYIKLSYKNEIKSWLQSCKKDIDNNIIIPQVPEEERKDTVNKISSLIDEYLYIIEKLTNELTEKEKIISILAKNYNSVTNAFKIYKDANSKFKGIKKINFNNPEYPRYKIYKSIRKLKAHIIETKLCGDDDTSLLNKLCNKDLEWEINEINYVTLRGWGFYIFKRENTSNKNKIEFKFNKKIFTDCTYKIFKDGKIQIKPFQKYKNWDNNVFEQLMQDNIEKTDLFNEIQKIIKEEMA